MTVTAVCCCRKIKEAGSMIGTGPSHEVDKFAENGTLSF
jgi:hypothetical protein